MLRRARSFASRSAHFAHRQVLQRRARPFRERRLADLAHFDNDRATQLAEVVRAITEGEVPTPSASAGIEAERQRMLEDGSQLRAPDGEPDFNAAMTVKAACRASRKLEDALALYHLIAHLGCQRGVELGTNVGISGAYIAAALAEQAGHLTTFEGSRARASKAQQLHAKLGLSNVDYVVGLFSDTIPGQLPDAIDFAFIDGHHQYQPTLDYFDHIFERSVDGAVMVFDDIRWSRGMIRAWRKLQADRRLVMAVDLCNLGIGVVTKAPAPIRLVTDIIAS